MKSFIFIQSEAGVINKNSLEALCGIQKLTSDLSITAVTFDEQSIETLSGYNIDRVLHLKNPLLQSYNPLAYVEAIQKIIQTEQPKLFAFGHTYEARDWVPRLSARLDIPFISDCTKIRFENSTIFTRQIYQGKVACDLTSSSETTILSIQSGSYRSDEIISGSSAAVENQEVDIIDDKRISQEDKFQESKGTVDLANSELIVSIGRGIEKEENIPLAEELAQAIGADIGSSRPVVDYGWVPHDRQIGSSGHIVSPKLYLAVGISGAVQHQVGMKGSEAIIAINKDKNAPIFEIADIGIVGDLFEIIPKLTTAIKEHKQKT